MLALVAVLCTLPAARAADAGEDQRERVVKAALEELMRHKFSEIAENPELRRRWWDIIWTAWSRTPDQYLPDFSDFDKNGYFDAPPARGETETMTPRSVNCPTAQERKSTKDADVKDGGIRYRANRV